jgi:excinuclease ABC subunit C
VLRQNKKVDLPKETGVYFFYDKEDTLLYIGKAKNINQRVKQHKKDQVPWKEKIHRVDFRLTATEEEALLLEQKLVREKLPKYNVRLRDDKSYSYIAISYDEDFPRVYLTKEKHLSGRRYFGPYINTRRGRRIVKTLARIYPFRSCQGKSPGREVNPCLDWHLGLCGAPCVDRISQEEYLENIKKIDSILSGKTQEVEKDLQEKMSTAAAKQQFEKAALYRDRLEDLSAVSGTREKRESYDALILLGNKVFLAPFRDSHSERGTLFHLQNSEEKNEQENLTSFLLQYYRDPPNEVLVEIEPDPLSVKAFKRKYPKSNLRVAKKGKKKDFIKRARREAMLKEANLSANKERRLQAFREIEKHLGYKITRIETYDASNLGLDNLYVSMVVFDEDGAVKSGYRVFSLRSQKGINDYLALETALKRRKASWKREVKKKANGQKYDASFSEKPDLVLIDGGKGQLNRARQTLKGFVKDEAIFSLAKRDEEIFQMGGLVEWRETSPPSLLFQEMRDEAHRFALKHNRKARKIASPLEEIKGVGKKKKLLLEKEIEDLPSASLEELVSVEGISKNLAEKIYQHFHKR